MSSFPLKNKNRDIKNAAFLSDIFVTMKKKNDHCHTQQKIHLMEAQSGNIYCKIKCINALCIIFLLPVAYSLNTLFSCREKCT